MFSARLRTPIVEENKLLPEAVYFFHVWLFSFHVWLFVSMFGYFASMFGYFVSMFGYFVPYLDELGFCLMSIRKCSRLVFPDLYRLTSGFKKWRRMSQIKSRDTLSTFVSEHNENYCFSSLKYCAQCSISKDSL